MVLIIVVIATMIQTQERMTDTKSEGVMKMLAKLQFWLFSKGANKDHVFYENLGNLVQDVRTKLNA